ncbi:MAG TPA: hypothetical protein VFT04_09470 [Gemmatimonadales bacterium]|nr:hypothetical protein [Gemmatimonadales bacterium]
MRREGFRVAVIAAALAAAEAAPAIGQVSGGVSALAVYDRVDPVPLGGALGEVRVIHPVAMLHAATLGGRLSFAGMANLEGLTLEDGQLAPGVAGEGYADRRHPHTYLHEAVATFEQTSPIGAARITWSISAGKGFAPFGSDDPMSRPVIRYPVNHHLAQVLERLVGVAAARSGPAGLEAALFNGDEPDAPDQWPNAGRFGDSWAVRLTLYPTDGIEVQGSLASIASPEHRSGGGLDHSQQSVSARLEREVGRHRLYGLAELARSDDGAFALHSFLAEGAWGAGRHQVHYRFERTERTEEQRLTDPWRTPRPHHDFSNLGITRWSLHTVGYAFDAPGPKGIEITPMVEATYGRVHSLTPDSFDPELFYGADTFWTVSAGVRIGWGARLHRMGRYGAAAVRNAELSGSGVEHIH